MILQELNDASPKPDQKKWDKIWSEEDEAPYFREYVRIDDSFYHLKGYERQIKEELIWDAIKSLITSDGEDLEIHEYGCGLGENLVFLKEFGINRLKGFDFSQMAAMKVRAKGIDAHVFDMEGAAFQPERNYNADQKIALTVHSLEQLKNPRPFLEFLKRHYDKCVHIEPVYEFYDPLNIYDYLAMQWHKKKGYVEGLLESIPGKIIYKGRSQICGLMHNAYSTIIWEC